MRIELSFADDVATMRLSGKFLAGSDGPYLRKKVSDLVEAGTQKLILNFEDVPYIDSTGLGFLAGSQKAATAAGVAIVLASVNPHVKKVLDSVQLSQFFTFADNEAKAREQLKGVRPTAAEQTPAKSSKGRKRAAPPAPKPEPEA